MHLPGKITYKEIDEMITTVDKNEDWKISYSEFRVGIFRLTLQKIKYKICSREMFIFQSEFFIQFIFEALTYVLNFTTNVINIC